MLRAPIDGLPSDFVKEDAERQSVLRIKTDKRNMALYETTFVVRQDATPQDVEKLTEGYTELLKEQGGKVVKKESWGLRNLAYKIKKHRKGHYVFLCIEADGPAIAELERKFRINEDVVRYMTVRVEEFAKGPSVVLKQQNAA